MNYVTMPMPPTAVDGYHVDISYEAFEPRRIDMMMLLPTVVLWKVLPLMIPRRRIVMIVNDHIPSKPPVSVGTRLNIDRPRHAILRLQHRQHHDHCCYYWVRTRSGVPVGHVAAPGPDQDCASAARTTVPPWCGEAREVGRERGGAPRISVTNSLPRDFSYILNNVGNQRNRAWYDE